jgi:hypothetical protein
MMYLMLAIYVQAVTDRERFPCLPQIKEAQAKSIVTVGMTRAEVERVLGEGGLYIGSGLFGSSESGSYRRNRLLVWYTDGRVRKIEPLLIIEGKRSK